MAGNLGRGSGRAFRCGDRLDSLSYALPAVARFRDYLPQVLLPQVLLPMTPQMLLPNRARTPRISEKFERIVKRMTFPPVGFYRRFVRLADCFASLPLSPFGSV